MTYIEKITIKNVLTLTTLTAVALTAFLAFSGSTQAQTLTHTQISGTLPEKETEGSAFIQWGGGTIYQLTARLAVNGCDLNLLWVWDSQQERYTAGYTFDGPSFLNNNFNNLYKDNIPPSVIWVKCIDMINHIYGYGLLSEEEKAWVDGQPKGRDDVYNIYSGITDQATDCGDHWNEEVRNKVLPIFPTPQKLCIIKDPLVANQGKYNTNRNLLYSFGSWRFGLQPAIYVGVKDRPLAEFSNISTEIHELCHANQQWHAIKQRLTYDFMQQWEKDNSIFFDHGLSSKSDASSLYHATQAMREFINIIGFEVGERGWVLPENSIYNEGIYGSHNPGELSAELCSVYLMYNASLEIDMDENLFNIFKESDSKYLTDEVIAWLEKYVFVLPESRLAR